MGIKKIESYYYKIIKSKLLLHTRDMVLTFFQLSDTDDNIAVIYVSVRNGIEKVYNVIKYNVGKNGKIQRTKQADNIVLPVKLIEGIPIISDGSYITVLINIEVNQQEVTHFDHVYYIEPYNLRQHINGDIICDGIGDIQFEEPKKINIPMNNGNTFTLYNGFHLVIGIKGCEEHFVLTIQRFYLIHEQKIDEEEPFWEEQTDSDGFTYFKFVNKKAISSSSEQDSLSLSETEDSPLDPEETESSLDEEESYEKELEKLYEKLFNDKSSCNKEEYRRCIALLLRKNTMLEKELDELKKNK